MRAHGWTRHRWGNDGLSQALTFCWTRSLGFGLWSWVFELRENFVLRTLYLELRTLYLELYTLYFEHKAQSTKHKVQRPKTQDHLHPVHRIKQVFSLGIYANPQLLALTAQSLF